MRIRWSLLPSAASSVAATGDFDAAAENMNGGYVLSPTPKSKFTDVLFPRRYSDYPHRETRYADVYSPEMSTLYSQVYWTRMGSVPLPPDLVESFDGKGMAVIGFEVDQVIKAPPGKGGDDASVPITVAYNHHFEATLLGKDSRLVKVLPSDPRARDAMSRGHGLPIDGDGYVWVAVDAPKDGDGGGDGDDGDGDGIPDHQDLGAANGGEFRMSYHGFPPGYAKAVKSPVALSVTPMQIDTWNRDAVNLTDAGAFVGEFVPGPVPGNSLAPEKGSADATYSGLLECPLTTRVRKNVEGLKYRKSVGSDGRCRRIRTPDECFDAVANVTLGPDDDDRNRTDWNQSVTNSSLVPSGCAVRLSSGRVGAGPRRVVFNRDMSSPVPCGRGGDSSAVYSGKQSSLVHLEVELRVGPRSARKATVAMSGPSDVWFGVGFNATKMSDVPWAITVDGDGNVTERRLGQEGGGGTTTPLPPSVDVMSNAVRNGVRTVVMERPMQGKDGRYYTFDEEVTDLNFINAIGSTPEVSYHKSRTASAITILPRNGEPICICSSPPPPFGKARGTLVYEDGTEVGFPNVCPPKPRGDLLDERNPTCDIRTYAGGQSACHHMWYLLDSDQEIPRTDRPLRYRLKFRIWYQEYDPSYHRPLYRTTWGIGSPVEYDVPQCPPGTPTESCVHTITGTFDVKDRSDGRAIRLVAAHFHCHAPTCLYTELHDDGTGELLCRQDALYGRGRSADVGESGGGGGGGGGDGRFDEAGFIAVPPCLWGGAEYGLEAPPAVSGRRLRAVKAANSTYGHHGEMAWLQILYELGDDDDGGGGVGGAEEVE